MVGALDSWSTRLVSTLDHTNVDNKLPLDGALGLSTDETF